MDYYLDTKGFECPIPVLKAEKFIKKLKKNDVLSPVRKIKVWMRVNKIKINIKFFLLFLNIRIDKPRKIGDNLLK